MCCVRVLVRRDRAVSEQVSCLGLPCSIALVVPTVKVRVQHKGQEQRGKLESARTLERKSTSSTARIIPMLPIVFRPDFSGSEIFSRQGNAKPNSGSSVQLFGTARSYSDANPQHEY